MFGFPVEFHKSGFALRINHAEGMHTETFHHSQGTGNRTIRHDPHDHVHAFRRQGDEIPKIIVRGLRLRKTTVGFLFSGVNQIRKFHGILDKKYRDVIADNVPVAFLRIQLDGKAAYVPRQIGRPFITCYG